MAKFIPVTESDILKVFGQSFYLLIELIVTFVTKTTLLMLTTQFDEIHFPKHFSNKHTSVDEEPNSF